MARKRKSTLKHKPRAAARKRVERRLKVAGKAAGFRPAQDALKFGLCKKIIPLLTETSVVIYAARAGGDYGATFISENVRLLTGYSARSFLRNRSFWIDHIHPDDRQRALEEAARVRKDKFHAYEYRFRRKDGTYMWVYDEMKLVCEAKGQPMEIVGYWTDITKRKTIEEDIRKRSERIIDFMEAATEGFVLVDSKFDVIHVNRLLLDAFGVSADEVRKMNVLDVVGDAWESGRYDTYMDVLRTGKPCMFRDVVAPLKYGERHLDLFAFKVGDNLGLIVHDVTDEKQREQRLREGEERLQSLYDSIHAGIVFCDTAGVVLVANAVACDMLNVDEDEVLGMKLLKVLGDMTDEKGIPVAGGSDPLTKTLETSTPVRNAVIGFEHNDPLGMRWLMVSTQPIFDSVTGKFDEVLVSLIDFTEQKQIEEALFESEERYRHIFENNPVGIGISTLDGKVITANRAMIEITGYSLDEFRKTNLAETYASGEERTRMLDQLKRNGRVVNYRVTLKRKDGTPYKAILNISRINIGSMQCYHTICMPAH